jgi:hypothetical protein
MIRALTLILGLMMLVQIVWPLNLPGLRRRADAWKIALGAMAIISIVALIRPV